jgi:hypothetical protein
VLHDALWQENRDIADACLRQRFVRELAKGPRKNSFTDAGRACSSSWVGSCGG